MFKKVIVCFLIFNTVSIFGMSLKELNTISKVELMQIKGIGEAKAETIIKERTKSKFKSIEDIIRIKGIGKAIVKNIHENRKSKVSKKEKIKY